MVHFGRDLFTEPTMLIKIKDVQTCTLAQFSPETSLISYCRILDQYWRIKRGVLGPIRTLRRGYFG